MEYKRIVCESRDISCTDINYNDCIVDYIVYCELKFYGINDEKYEIDIYDDKNRNYIGKISGYIILCNIMDRDGENAYDVCDEHSVDLEMVYSVLSDHDSIFIDEDILYIEYTDLCGEVFDVIMNSLPDTVLTNYHVRPGIVCYYPAPLPYKEEKPLDKKVKEEMAQIIARDAMARNILGMSGSKSNTDDDYEDEYDDEMPENNDLSIQLRLDEEQQNYILGRWNDYNVYPESAKNLEEFRKFEKAGFKEYHNSRLLVKFK